MFGEETFSKHFMKEAFLNEQVDQLLLLVWNFFTALRSMKLLLKFAIRFFFSCEFWIELQADRLKMAFKDFEYLLVFTSSIFALRNGVKVFKCAVNELSECLRFIKVKSL